jgi:hypothetical protein
MPAGANVDTGAALVLAGLTAGSLDADLVPSTYVGQYKWLSLYLGSDSYNGILTPEMSFDEVVWQAVKMLPLTTLDAGDVSTSGFDSATNVMLGTLSFAPFFRVRMTSYTSGSASGVFTAYTDGMPGFQMLNTYVRLASNNGQIGYTNNDGRQSLAVAAGHLGDTFIGGPGMLGSILVTATGTTPLIFYDNNAASGTIIATIPAAATVNGVPYVCHAPFVNGIFLAGNSNNAGITIFY